MTTIQEQCVPTRPNLSIGSFVQEGTLHNRISLGLQDACHIVDWEDLKVAVVCDGCSATNLGLSQNQVGAVLGAQYISSTLAIALRDVSKNDDIYFEKILQVTRNKTHTFFRRLCNSMGFNARELNKEYKDFVRNKLLFTVLGFAVFRHRYWIFGLGDGWYGINGEITILDSSPYLNQSLLNRGRLKKKLKIYATDRIDNLEYLWIASDGLSDFLSDSPGKKDFDNFLGDELTCERNSKGEDTTVQAFNRKVYNRHKHRFSDDVALALVKTKA